MSTKEYFSTDGVVDFDAKESTKPEALEKKSITSAMSSLRRAVIDAECVADRSSSADEIVPFAQHPMDRKMEKEDAAQMLSSKRASNNVVGNSTVAPSNTARSKQTVSNNKERKTQIMNDAATSHDYAAPYHDQQRSEVRRFSSDGSFPSSAVSIPSNDDTDDTNAFIPHHSSSVAIANPVSPEDIHRQFRDDALQEILGGVVSADIVVPEKPSRRHRWICVIVAFIVLVVAVVIPVVVTRQKSTSSNQAQLLRSCTTESEAIAANTEISNQSNAIVLPYCQRNATGATCIADYTFAAIQVAPRCQAIDGGQFLTHDYLFQCTSQSGAVFTIQHVNQPSCVGVSCSQSNRIEPNLTDLFKSSLFNQAYRNCSLLSSSTSQNVSVQQLNASLASIGGGECAAATNNLTSDTSLTATYELMSSLIETASPYCNSSTTDFSNQAEKFDSQCATLGGTYIAEDFAIGCDHSAVVGANGNNASCVYNYQNVFLCLGNICNGSEIDAYLEWPLVSQHQILESSSRQRNCQVRVEDHSVAGGQSAEYLPSVWGAKCAVEKTSIATSFTLGSNSVMLACERDQKSTFICGSNFIGLNTQEAASCPSSAGNYSEIDMALTCTSAADSTEFVIEYLHYPTCAGVSCNVSQSDAAALQAIQVQLELYGIQNCQLASLNHSYQAALSRTNASGEVCALQTNELNSNPTWSKILSTPGLINSTYDYSPFITLTSAKSTCKSLGGQYVEANFTVRNCVQSGSINTYNYVRDFFCFGGGCQLTQLRSYVQGVFFLNQMVSNCSNGTFDFILF